MQSEMLKSNSDTYQGKTEKLARDFGGVVADAGDLARTVGAEVEGKLDRAQARLAEARSAMTGRMRRATDATNEYIRTNPWKVLGIAAAAGLVIGLLASFGTIRSNRH